MRFKRKLIVMIATVVASKHSIAGSVGAGLFGAALAPSLGFDPWTWIVGAIGGIVVRVKLPPTNRADSLVNGIISVMLAGLASPWIAKGFSTLINSFPAPSVYLVAFSLAVAWPWVVKVGWEAGKKRINKWGES